MHIQDTAGNAQPHLSIDLHSDTESKETDMPQHITKKMQRTRQWIKTGELFPKPTVGLAEDPKTLLSHLKHLSEDLANTHVTRNTNVTQTLDHLIKHAQALTTIAGHDSANFNSGKKPDKSEGLDTDWGEKSPAERHRAMTGFCSCKTGIHAILGNNLDAAT